jgi:hypothetical protein
MNEELKQALREAMKMWSDWHAMTFEFRGEYHRTPETSPSAQERELWERCKRLTED